MYVSLPCPLSKAFMHCNGEVCALSSKLFLSAFILVQQTATLNSEHSDELQLRYTR